MSVFLEESLFLFRPDFRPFLRNLMVQSPPTADSSSANHSQTSIDEFVLKLLNYFVTVELLLLKKLSNEALATNSNEFSSCDPNLVKLVLPNVENEEKDRRKIDTSKMATCRLVGAGFSHVLIVRPRSGALFSFGSTHFGVLAHNGPLMTSSGSITQQHSPPKQVSKDHLIIKNSSAGFFD